MYILPAALIAVLVALDQYTKYLATVYLGPSNSMDVIEGVFSFTFVLNDGAAFGLFPGGRWFFLLFAVIILGGMGYYYIKLPESRVNRYIKAALILIGAGAIGNFIDRLVSGKVVDFLHVRFIDFPVFNLADVYVVAGAVLLGILLVFFMKDDPAEEETAPSQPDAPDAIEKENN